ncbi:unnamed protein product [Adineta steineri]|uniref:Uncharacterized protein n=1 Tax=Adineta steineri TaxID=433720 RepID=A0A820QNE0_9BILA|nr:unnamed protein product [Adineta steineri]
MYSLPDGDPCNGHSTMLGALVADDEPYWRCLDDAAPGDGGAMLDAMMMLDLLDDGALAFDDPDGDGLGAMMEMMVMT